MPNKLLLLLLMLLCACKLETDPAEFLTSGIKVQALIGPICPVVQADQSCPDQPYQATLSVLNADRIQLLQFETAADGSYTANLPPGEYILHPESPNNMQLPFAHEQEFTVRADEFTILEVIYDSGIR